VKLSGIDFLCIARLYSAIEIDRSLQRQHSAGPPYLLRESDRGSARVCAEIDDISALGQSCESRYWSVVEKGSVELGHMTESLRNRHCAAGVEKIGQV